MHPNDNDSHCQETLRATYGEALDAGLEEIEKWIAASRADPELAGEWDEISEWIGRRADSLLPDVLSLAARTPYYSSRVTESSPRLEDFPVIGKPDLRANFADLISRDGASDSLVDPPHVISRTGGSTGQSISVIRGGRDLLADTVLEETLYRELDLPEQLEILDLSLRQADQPIIDLQLASRTSVIWNLSWAWGVPPPVQAEWLEVLERADASLLRGAPSRLVDFARFCQRESIELRPKAITTTYEALSASARGLLEEVFRCRVVSVLSTAETGITAWECPAGAFHFRLGWVHPEVLPSEETPNGAGRLLVTSLKGQAMPIIRYDLGDIVRPLGHTCTCGNTEDQAIADLEGRTTSLVYGKSGRGYSGYTLMRAFDDLGIFEYQVVQPEKGLLQLLVASDLEPEHLVAGLQERLAHYRWSMFDERAITEDFAYSVTRTSSFYLSPSGKRNAIVPVGASH